MSKFMVFNIGCIECGVSSAVVGVFADKEQADRLSEALGKSHAWRDGGQNQFEVFELPEPETIGADYLEPPK